MAQLDVTARGYHGPLDEGPAGEWLAALFQPDADVLVTRLDRETVDVANMAQPDPVQMPTGRATVHAVVSFPRR